MDCFLWFVSGAGTAIAVLMFFSYRRYKRDARIIREAIAQELDE